MLRLCALLCVAHQHPRLAPLTPSQVGIKSQLSGATVQLALFLGNKGGEALTQVG